MSHLEQTNTWWKEFFSKNHKHSLSNSTWSYLICLTQPFLKFCPCRLPGITTTTASRRRPSTMPWGRGAPVMMPAGCGCGFVDLWLDIVTLVISNWLVVWLPFFIFPYIGNVIIPIDVHIFQRGSHHQQWYGFFKFQAVGNVRANYTMLCTCTFIHMEVSWNGGTSKSSILMGFFPINQPFWGSPFMETPIYRWI